MALAQARFGATVSLAHREPARHVEGLDGLGGEGHQLFVEGVDFDHELAFLRRRGLGDGAQQARGACKGRM